MTSRVTIPFAMILAAATAAVVASASSMRRAEPPVPVPALSPEPAAPQPIAEFDLMTTGGCTIFGAQWRYSDVKIVESPFTEPGDRDKPGAPNSTYDISPRAGEADFDDSAWPIIDPTTLGDRRAGGKVCFNWYRVTLTMPSAFDGIDLTGTRAVLSVTVDDYAEVWVNGQLPRALNQPNPNLITGFNTPNRVILSMDVKPGQKVQVAVFGINGPISAAPTNYVWFREAKVSFHRPANADGARP